MFCVFCFLVFCWLFFFFVCLLLSCLLCLLQLLISYLLHKFCTLEMSLFVCLSLFDVGTVVVVAVVCRCCGLSLLLLSLYLEVSVRRSLLPLTHTRARAHHPLARPLTHPLTCSLAHSLRHSLLRADLASRRHHQGAHFGRRWLGHVWPQHYC